MARKIDILLLLLLATSCHRRVAVETVERTVVVHDTVHVETQLPKPQRYALDDVADSALAQYPDLLAQVNVAWYVADLSSNAILTARGERQRMRTASVMKAVTAITALATIPCADSAFVTRVVTDGAKAWVKGGWDPLLSPDDVNALARQARSRLPRSMSAVPGVDVKGQDEAHYGKGWCWDDHNPLLTPLFYAPLIERRKRNPIDRPEQDFADAFARAWRNAPAGKAGSVEHGVVASVVRALPEVLAPMLKESDNLMAEAVWRLTGESHKQRQQALSSVMAEAGVEEGEVTQADGSGLSLYNYASPLALAKLLQWADCQPFAPVLRRCLSCMGVDGTLKNREVPGVRIEAKTGTVDGVITLAGYMTLADGHRMVFVVMMNGVPDKMQARSATDALLARIAGALQ